MSKIVERTLDFVELFAEHRRPLSLSEISRLLVIPVSSCHDVLHSLQERGYVYELGPRGGFYPTLKLHRLAARITDGDPVVQRAELRLRQLRDQLDESVSLARMDDAQATYLMVFEPSHPLRFLVRVGDKARSLYATSAGKAVLGSLDARRFDEVLAGLKLVPLTDRTLRSGVALRREIAMSRERGWYANREESVPAVTTVSATFRWSRSVFIVTIAGPTFRMDSRMDEVVSQLRSACCDLESPESTVPAGADPCPPATRRRSSCRPSV